MPSQKITMKDFTIGSKQVLHELRDLQKAGLTLPDIIYNYRIDEGHLIRRRFREGSESGSDREDDDPPYDPEKSKANVEAFLNSTPTSTPNPLPELDRNAQVEAFLRPSESLAPELPPRPNLPPYSVFDPAASNADSSAGSSSGPKSEPELSPDVKPERRIPRKAIPAPVPKKEEDFKEQKIIHEGETHKDKHVKFGSIRIIGDGAKGRKMVGEDSEQTQESAQDK